MVLVVHVKHVTPVLAAPHLSQLHAEAAGVVLAGYSTLRGCAHQQGLYRGPPGARVYCGVLLGVHMLVSELLSAGPGHDA